MKDSRLLSKVPESFLKFLLPWVARLPRFDFSTTEDEYEEEKKPAAAGDEDPARETDATKVLPPRIVRGNARRRPRREMPAPPIPVSLVVAFLLIYMLCGSVSYRAPWLRSG